MLQTTERDQHRRPDDDPECDNRQRAVLADEHDGQSASRLNGKRSDDDQQFRRDGIQS